MRPDTKLQPPFAEFLGAKVTLVSPERVVAELLVREELGNRFGILHGGAIMAFADNLGGKIGRASCRERVRVPVVAGLVDDRHVRDVVSDGGDAVSGAVGVDGELARSQGDGG